MSESGPLSWGHDPQQGVLMRFPAAYFLATAVGAIPSGAQHLRDNQKLIDKKEYMEDRLNRYLMLEIQNLQNQNTAPWRIQATLIESLVQSEWNDSMQDIFKFHVQLAILKLDASLLPLQQNESSIATAELNQIVRTLSEQRQGHEGCWAHFKHLCVVS